MKETVLFNDDFSGIRYRYGILYRPLSSFSAPKDFIIQSDAPDPRFNFGTVDYPRELTEDECRSFQLQYIGHSRMQSNFKNPEFCRMNLVKR